MQCECRTTYPCLFHSFPSFPLFGHRSRHPFIFIRPFKCSTFPASYFKNQHLSNPPIPFAALFTFYLTRISAFQKNNIRPSEFEVIRCFLDALSLKNIMVQKSNRGVQNFNFQEFGIEMKLFPTKNHGHLGWQLST